MAKQKWKLTPKDVREMAAMYANGYPNYLIAKHFHLHHSTVIYWQRKCNFTRGTQQETYVSLHVEHVETKQEEVCEGKDYADYLKDEKERREKARIKSIILPW